MTVTDQHRQALDRTVACVNTKGGVGKTSIVANIAGQLAQEGVRVLVVDFDARPGGIRVHLGIVDHPQISQGEAILEALRYPSAGELEVIEGVRENLDFVCGGEALNALTLIADREEDGVTAQVMADHFVEALAALAEDYDLVLIDVAPQNPLLQDFALHAAKWVLEPMKADHDSLSGILAIDSRVALARETNPGLEYIGVLVPFLKRQSSRVLREMREDLAGLEVEVPILDLFIRPSDTVPWDTTRSGKLVHELLADSATEKRALLDFLRRRREDGQDDSASAPVRRGTETARGVAEDYAEVANALLTRILGSER